MVPKDSPGLVIRDGGAICRAKPLLLQRQELDRKRLWIPIGQVYQTSKPPKSLQA
jgi:hypothetical protein